MKKLFYGFMMFVASSLGCSICQGPDESGPVRSIGGMPSEAVYAESVEYSSLPAEAETSPPTRARGSSTR